MGGHLTHLNPTGHLQTILRAWPEPLLNKVLSVKNRFCTERINKKSLENGSQTTPGGDTTNTPLLFVWFSAKMWIEKAGPFVFMALQRSRIPSRTSRNVSIIQTKRKKVRISESEFCQRKVQQCSLLRAENSRRGAAAVRGEAGVCFVLKLI